MEVSPSKEEKLIPAHLFLKMLFPNYVKTTECLGRAMLNGSLCSTKIRILRGGPVQTAGGSSPFHALSCPRLLRPTSRITIAPKNLAIGKIQRTVKF